MIVFSLASPVLLLFGSVVISCPFSRMNNNNNNNNNNNDNYNRIILKNLETK